MQRIIAYIDGFNLYYGLRERGWKWAYWINLHALVSSYLLPEQVLSCVKYFTAVVSTPPDKQRRQNKFLEALGTLPNFYIYKGNFLSNDVTCHACGHTYVAFHEKMTDVNIATELLVDTFSDKFDVAFLLSGDSDLAPPIKAVRRLFPSKHIISLFPPRRKSKELIKWVNGYENISQTNLSNSLFPDRVQKANGYILHRPKRWK